MKPKAYFFLTKKNIRKKTIWMLSIHILEKSSSFFTRNILASMSIEMITPCPRLYVLGEIFSSDNCFCSWTSPFIIKLRIYIKHFNFYGIHCIWYLFVFNFWDFIFADTLERGGGKPKLGSDRVLNRRSLSERDINDICK